MNSRLFVAVLACGMSVLSAGLFAVPNPPDFAAYWKGERVRLEREVPLDAKMSLIAGGADEKFVRYNVSFATFGGKRVYGFLAVPKDLSKGPFRVQVTVPGAGPGGIARHMVSDGTYVAMTVNVHPFEPGVTREEQQKRYEDYNAALQKKWNSKSAYPTAGLASSREDEFFHDSFLGIARAVDWVAELPFADKSNIVYCGGSQGGFAGLALTALTGRFTKTYVYVPAACDHFSAEECGEPAPWPRALTAYENDSDENRRRVRRNLPYFDGVNFARLVTNSVKVVLGLADKTCPPHGIRTMFAALKSADKELVEVPLMPHTTPGGSLGRALNRWLADPKSTVRIADVWNPALENRALPPVTILPAPGHSDVTLVKDGKPRFVIVGEFRKEAAVRGPEGQPLSKFGRNSKYRAAAFLKDAFAKTTGVVPKVREADDPCVKDFDCVIAIGRTRFSDALKVDATKLPREGFEVRTFDKGVVIVGRDEFQEPGVGDKFIWRNGRISMNGTEWGAIDFAERFLGMRRYSPVPEGLWDVVPEIKDLSLRPMAYSDYPRLSMRKPRNWGWRQAEATDLLCVEAPHPFDFAKAHPDKIEDCFYRDARGRLWQHPTSYSDNFFDITNPKFVETLADDYRQYYDRDGLNTYWKASHAPSERCMWFCQVDHGVGIDNVRAKPFLHADMPSMMSDVYANFYGELGKAIAERLPGKRIIVAAYSNYIRPPRIVKSLPDNVQVETCIGTPVFVRSPKYMDFFFSTVKGWGALTKNYKPCIYTYDAAYTKDGVIEQTLRGYFEAEFLKKAWPCIDHEFLYSCVNHDNYKVYNWSGYLTLRALWNPESDPEAILAEYFPLMYGEKAGAILNDFFHLIVKRWTNFYIPYAEEGRLYVSIPAPNLKRLYTTTFPAGVLNQLEAMLAAAEKEIAAGSKEAQRFEQFAGPYRKTFRAIRDYQNIRYPEVRVPQTSAADVGFRAAFAGGEPQTRGTVGRFRWDEKGLYVAYSSPGPYKAEGKAIWKDDCMELMVSPGTKAEKVYQFALSAADQYTDIFRQLDPPRPSDPNWEAKEVRHSVERKADSWSAEIFIPWTAFEDPAPKAGETWHINLISNRTSPAETLSVSPTLNNNYRAEMYGRFTFVKDEAEHRAEKKNEVSEVVQIGGPTDKSGKFYRIVCPRQPAYRGEMMVIKLEAKGQGTGSVALARYTDKGKWNQAEPNKSFALTDSWTAHEIELPVDDGLIGATASAQVMLSVSKKGGEAQFRNVSMTKSTKKVGTSYRDQPLPTKIVPAETFDPVKAGWPLVFSEDFDGREIDWSKWFVPSWRIKDKDLVKLDGQGHLLVQAKPDAGGDGMRTTGLWTKPGFTYGYFEARLKFTRKPGWWAAFWLYGISNCNPFLDGLEVDIFEDLSTRGGKPDVSHNMHNITTSAMKSWSYHSDLPGTLDDWYTVGCKWTPFEISEYINGKLIRTRPANMSRKTATFDVFETAACTAPLHAILSGSSSRHAKELGGELEPEDFVVDSLKVYALPESEKGPAVSWKSETGARVVKPGDRLLFAVNVKSARGVKAAYLFDNGYLVATKTEPPYAFDLDFCPDYYYTTRYMKPGRSGALPDFDGYPHVFTVYAEDKSGKVSATSPVIRVPQSVVGKRPWDGKKLGLVRSTDCFSMAFDAKDSGTYALRLRYGTSFDFPHRCVLLADGVEVGTFDLPTGENRQAEVRVSLKKGAHDLLFVPIGIFGVNGFEWEKSK